MSSLGNRLKEERKRLGLNQTEMAEHGGVQITAQANYEKDVRRPDADYLFGINKIGADILYIITGKRTPIQMSSLSIEETSLVDYYRNAAAEGRKALEATGAAVAKPKKAK